MCLVIDLMRFWCGSSKQEIKLLNVISLQCKGSNWDLFPNQYLFKESPIFYNGNDDLSLKSSLTPIVNNSTALFWFDIDYKKHFQ